MSGINTNYNNNGFNYPIQDNKEPIDGNKVSGLGINEEIANLEKEIARLKEGLDNIHKEIREAKIKYHQQPNLLSAIIKIKELEINEITREIEMLENLKEELTGNISINPTNNNFVSESPQNTQPLTGLFSLIREQKKSS